MAQSKAPLQFSIVAQPLAAALDVYSAVSNRELYYDGALVAGRHSNAVKGLLAPDAALRQLLVGSGLFARPTGPNSFTIAPASQSRTATATYQSYFAAIQTRVARTLCAYPEIQPRAEDLLIQLWITSSGTVQRVKVLDGPGDRHADTVAAALRGVSIGVSQPAGTPQPIMMAILARHGDQSNGCAPAGMKATR